MVVCAFVACFEVAFFLEFFEVFADGLDGYAEFVADVFLLMWGWFVMTSSRIWKRREFSLSRSRGLGFLVLD